MSKVNLPAALNDPRLSRRETDFFTKTWGESFNLQGVFPSPNLPEVNKEDIRRHLKRISKRSLDLITRLFQRHLGSQLAEIEHLIERMMQEDFVFYATTDLNRPLSEADALLDETVIEAISQAEDLDTDNGIGSLADQMRLLQYPQWMALLQQVFSNLIIILKRVKNVCAMIDEVMVAASGPGRPASSPGDASPHTPTSPIRVSVGDMEKMLNLAECQKLQGSLNEMLCKVCDHAHDRCVKLLLARSKDGFLEKLASIEFVKLSRAVESFVSEGENLCGRRSTSLRASLQSQASRFVNRFHEERKTKLSLILDNERWKQADVPAEFQDLVNHISSSQTLSLPGKQLSDKKPQECLFVEEERYAVVGTVLLLVKMVVEYCQCVGDIPAAAPDLLARLVELLKMFNSRTCQLILGAGAVQLVGLRTISTKNLALASRCLQLVVYFLPLVRSHFDVQLQNKQRNMLKHFDSILKDYNDHIAELANKLLYIMDSMMETCLAKWEVKPPMPSAAFRNISKQMSKLHEGISDILPASQVAALFKRVHENFKLFLRSQLIKLGVTNDGGPQHGLVVADVTFYMSNLRMLEGMEHLNNSMDDIWDKR